MSDQTKEELIEEIKLLQKRIVEFEILNGERKKVEELLQESEKRTNDIIFSLADWVWEVDENGVYTYSSQKGSDIIGRSSEEIIGKMPFDFMPPDEAKRVAAIFLEIVSHKAPIKDLDNWNIRKDGKKICLRTNGVPILDKQGNLKGYRGIDKDITEYKLAEEALKESEKRFMDVLYASRDAILLIDGNIFVDCNEATAIMLGYATRKEFLMTHPSKLSPDMQPDGRSSFDKAEEMMQIASDKGYHRFVWMHRKANAEDFLVEVSLTPVSLHGKTVIHCVWRDLTETKKIEEIEHRHMKELEIFYKVAMGREERIIELKKEVDGLKKKISK